MLKKRKRKLMPQMERRRREKRKRRKKSLQKRSASLVLSTRPKQEMCIKQCEHPHGRATFEVQKALKSTFKWKLVVPKLGAGQSLAILTGVHTLIIPRRSSRLKLVLHHLDIANHYVVRFQFRFRASFGLEF